MMTSSPLELPPPPARRRRRTVRVGWLLVSVISLLLVIGVLVLRSMYLQRPLTIGLVGVTPFFAVPLVIGLIGAWFSRSNLMRLGAAATAATFVITLGPVDAVVGCGGTTADDAITVYTANTLFDNPNADEFAAAVVAADADILVMQEVRWALRRSLEEDPRLDHLAYRSTDLARDGLTTIVWSRWAFTDFDLVPFEVSDAVRATVDSPYGPITVYGVHTFAPVFPENVGSWSRQLAQLAAIDQSTPHILAGDFNATSDHRQFRDLFDAGWTDVHQPKGCGLDATWPVQGLPFPVMRLDHVLVSDHFEVLDVKLGYTEGSDHLPVIASVRLQS